MGEQADAPQYVAGESKAEHCRRYQGQGWHCGCLDCEVCPYVPTEHAQGLTGGAFRIRTWREGHQQRAAPLAEVGVGEPMGTCDECRFWEQRNPLSGLCRRVQDHGVAFAVEGGAQPVLVTMRRFGCREWMARIVPEPAAPDWQALADRRGAALTDLHYQCEAVRRQVLQLPPGYPRDCALAHLGYMDAKAQAAARDAGPEAR